MPQRVFAYGQTLDYVLESIAILAAIGSGVASALMNLVIGQLMNIMSDPTLSTREPEIFMAAVSKNA